MGFYKGPNIVKDGLVMILDAASTRSFPNDSNTIWKDLSGNSNNGNIVRNSSMLNTVNPTPFQSEPYDVFDELSSTSLHYKKFNNTDYIWGGFDLNGKTCITWSTWRIQLTLEVISGDLKIFMGSSNGGYTEGPHRTYTEGTYTIDEIFTVDDTYAHETAQLEFSYVSMSPNGEARITNLDVREIGPVLENNALSFDGVDDMIYTSLQTASSFVDNQSFSIEVIVKFPTLPSIAGGLVCNQKYQTSSNAGGFGLVFDTHNKYYITMTDVDTSTSFENQCGIDITPNVFEHIIYTYDNNTQTIKGYKNSELINSSINTNYYWTTESRDTTIGYNQQGGWTNYNEMSIGLVKVYNRVLNLSDIEQNFNAYKNRYNI